MPSITALVDEIVRIPKPFRGALTRLLGIDHLDCIYHSTTEDRPIPEQLLDQLAVTYRVSGLDLQQVPRTGATVIVANHPFGILEGAVLATVLQRIRPDVRFLANQVLSGIPEIQDLIIPVDVLGGTVQNNAAGLRRAIEYLQGGGCLVVFPAGEVSHFQPREGMVADSRWHTVVARLVEALSRKGVAVATVPAYIRGSNSFVFQILGMLHRRIRTALLARELLNKRDRLVELRIGSPITQKRLLEIPTPKERTEYLRWRTYLLAGRSEFKPKTSFPLSESTPAAYSACGNGRRRPEHLDFGSRRADAGAATVPSGRSGSLRDSGSRDPGGLGRNRKTTRADVSSRRRGNREVDGR